MDRGLDQGPECQNEAEDPQHADDPPRARERVTADMRNPNGVSAVEHSRLVLQWVAGRWAGSKNQRDLLIQYVRSSPPPGENHPSSVRFRKAKPDEKPVETVYITLDLHYTNRGTHLVWSSETAGAPRFSGNVGPRDPR